MADTNSVQKNIGVVRALSNEMAAFLNGLPDGIWKDADRFASGCEGWKVGDVISHLVDQANQTTLSIERAISGSTAPPLGYKSVTADESDQQLKELRVAFDEDMFPEFNASCLRLNQKLVSLDSEQHDLEAWHPSGIRSVSRLVEYRVLELAVHGWDIKYAFDRNSPLSPTAMPFLTEFLERWLQSAFRGAEDLESSVRLRFDLGAAEGYDLTIRISGFALEPSTADDPDVLFEVTPSDYILLLTGRLSLRRSVRRGRVQLDGNDDLAYKLTEWFGPVHITDLI